jgi:tetratricopeptide (TPR) repeat protein
VKESKSMANSLVKGLALTLGGGLAVGLGIKIGQTSAPAAAPPEPFDMSPIADQMETLGNRINTVETLLKDPSPLLIPTVQDLEQRIHSRDTEVEELRAAIQRASEQQDARIQELGSAVNTFEAKIPDLIDQSIKPRIDEMQERVQREMQETASQTLEVFADRIQARVVEKITSIEGDLTRQSDAIKDLRDYSLKTDQNLQRLLAGVENLAEKINRKFESPVEAGRASTPVRPAAPSPAAAAAPAASAPGTEQRAATAAAAAAAPQAAPPVQAAPPAQAAKPASAESAPAQTAGKPAPKPVDFPTKIALGEASDVRPPREPFSFSGSKTGPEFDDLLGEKPKTNGYRNAALAGGGLALTALVVGGIELSGFLHKPASAHSTPQSAVSKVNAPVAAPATDILDTKKLTDQSELLDQARAYSQKRDYAKAEDIYRAILKSDPANTEVKRLLASALFRQEKIEESVKILNSISEDKQSKGEDSQH